MKTAAPDSARIDFEVLGACPTCRGSLKPASRSYDCQGCGARWPIIRGIPRFVDSQHYAGTFGYQWRRHRKTLLVSGRRTDTEQEFREKTGLKPEDVRGKLVLDVGVGNGRFAEVVARWGGRVVGVDLSQAVVSARANLSAYAGRIFLAQADLFHLPLKEESFDIVYSIGVLHHTPSTRAAFRAIARFVKPGGVVSTGIYQAADFLEYSARYRRYTAAMSHPWLHFLSHGAIPIYHVLRAAKTVLGPLRSSRLEKVFFIFMHEDAAWRTIGTFDWYSPRFQWLHTEDEVKRWFRDLGFDDVKRMPERKMHSVRGVLPVGSHLKEPPPSEEQRENALLDPPVWVPRRPQIVRDGILTALAALEVGRCLREIGPGLPPRVEQAARAVITSGVVATKRVVGIEREVLSSRIPERTGRQGRTP